jgi:hypothetical protein
MKKHLAKQLKMYSCPYCDEEFADSPSLTKHLRLHDIDVVQMLETEDQDLRNNEEQNNHNDEEGHVQMFSNAGALRRVQIRNVFSQEVGTEAPEGNLVDGKLITARES